VAKIVKPNNGSGALLSQGDWIYTYYVRDAAGNVIATYERTGATTENETFVNSDHTMYGSSRLGVQESGANMFSTLPVSKYHDRLRGSKTYEGSNHLGNVLVTFSDIKLCVPNGTTPSAVDYYLADVRSATDYYPFGMSMPGRKFNPTTYRYGFNGKENDGSGESASSAGEGSQDYGMRIYNPALGKFLSVDPLTSDYPWYTPYQFAGNKPVMAIDLDGAEEQPKTVTSYGGGTGAVGSNTITSDYIEPNVVPEYDGDGAKKVHGRSPDGPWGYSVNIPPNAGTIEDECGVTTYMGWTNKNGSVTDYSWNDGMQAYYNSSTNTIYGGAGTAIVNGYMNTAWGTSWGSEAHPNYSIGSLIGYGQNSANISSSTHELLQLGSKLAITGALKYVTWRYSRIYKLVDGVGTTKRGSQIASHFVANYRNNLILRSAENLGFIEIGLVNRYPDVMGKGIFRDTWWDITTNTKSSWRAHLRKYADPDNDKYYGPIGIGIFYSNKKSGIGF
jgi:RHS repeat-associated protein